MDRWVAGLIGNALSIHGLDQFFGTCAGKLFRVDVKDVGVVAIARTTRIELLGRDARYLGQEFVQQMGVSMPLSRLRIEARQLNSQKRALLLAQAVVRTVDEVAVEPLAGHTAAVVNAARLFFKRIVVRQDHAAFASGHELARLEAERPRSSM